MTRFILPIALGIGTVFASVAPADAQNGRCAPRDAVLKHLNGKYGESRQSMGLQSNGVVEVFSSDETGSWTIVITSTNGVTCMIAAGNSWEVNAGPVVTSENDA